MDKPAPKPPTSLPDSPALQVLRNAAQEWTDVLEEQEKARAKLQAELEEVTASIDDCHFHRNFIREAIERECLQVCKVK